MEWGELLEETRRREMEMQVKPTKALMIIVHFINSQKKKDRKDMVFFLSDLLFLQGKHDV